MANTELINVSMDSIEDLIAANVLDDIIINAINTIWKNKKRPDKTLIHELLKKKLKNANLTKITMNDRITFMSSNNCIANNLRQTKEKYFNNLNVSKASDNKTFWKSVKPFFSNKGLNSNNILLEEDNEKVNDDGKHATI